jgi:hypothetical protein
MTMTTSGIISVHYSPAGESFDAALGDAADDRGACERLAREWAREASKRLGAVCSVRIDARGQFPDGSRLYVECGDEDYVDGRYVDLEARVREVLDEAFTAAASR